MGNQGHRRQFVDQQPRPQASICSSIIFTQGTRGINLLIHHSTDSHKGHLGRTFRCLPRSERCAGSSGWKGAPEQLASEARSFTKPNSKLDLHHFCACNTSKNQKWPRQTLHRPNHLAPKACNSAHTVRNPEGTFHCQKPPFGGRHVVVVQIPTNRALVSWGLCLQSIGCCVLTAWWTHGGTGDILVQ